MKTLSDNCLKANRIRNKIAMLAIILTAILFTSVITVFLGAQENIKEQQLMMSGTRFMVSIKNLSKEKAEEIRNDEIFVKTGLEYPMAFAENKELNKISGIVMWMDEMNAKESYCMPQEGRLPEAADEIVCDSVVIKLLGVPYKLGEKFTLSYSVDGVPKEKEMTLCGIRKGDDLKEFSYLMVSQAFLNEHGIKEDSYTVRGNFSSEKEIGIQLDSLIKRAGFDPLAERGEKNFVIRHVNPAFERKSEIGFGTIAGILAAILLILFAGYLIIYNIFRISVIKDIRLYGQLKTIGTSPKQIQFMVRRQGMRLAVYSIPIGLVLGWLLGNVLLPLILKSSNFNNFQFVWPNLMVWVASGVFTFFTVWISCKRPEKIAGGISPVESLHYQEQDSIGRGRKRGTTSKHRILQMAYANLGRSKGKTILVILSLSLSIILLNCVLNGVGCFDEETYVKARTAADFNVMSVRMNKLIEESSSKTVTKEFADSIKELPNVLNFGRSYLYEQPRDEDGNTKASAMIKSLNDKVVPQDAMDGLIPERMVMGFDQDILKRGKIIEGELDYKKLSEDGNIIMVGYLDDYSEYSYDAQEFHAGDSVEVEIKGVNKTYQVLAVVGVPNEVLADYSIGGYEMIGFAENVFLENFPEAENPIHCLFDAKEGSFDSLNKYLTSKEDKQNIKIGTRLSAEKEFKDIMVTYSGVGIILSLVFAVIGILNLINVILTGAIARQGEFATMRSIGMSGKQLRKLFLWEGIFYALLAGVAGVLLGSILSVTMVRGIIEGFWFAKYEFQIFPAIFAAILCAGISGVVGYVIDGVWNRGSIVEKLRKVE